jgi:anthranilate synthase component 2/putative glutamine amidotransferase
MPKDRSQPLIGVTTYQEAATHGRWTEEAVFTPRTYTACLSDAGGAPVLLPPSLSNGQGALPEVIDRLDGLMLIGGEDVCGQVYGREETEEEHGREVHNPARDALEVEATRCAWETGLPILAICRGIQLLNVALGGTLVPDLVGAGASDEHRLVQGSFHDHLVEFEPGTLAYQLLGPATQVPSHHHQAVERVADVLRVSGRSQDGVVEAAEAGDGRPFVLGVQWHPEEGQDPTLFAAFVEACRGAA